MKRGDFVWGLILLIFIAFLLVPDSRAAFIAATEVHPYICGFFKYIILASMGDLLGARIINGYWSKTKGMIYKGIVWGTIGIMITLVFTVYSSGVTYAQEVGKLPFEGVTIANAFFISVVMNFTFGIFMFLYHKFTDLYIDMKVDRKGGKVTVTELVDHLDWHTLISFTILKTLPFFWVPAQTITYLIPGEYRVLFSAFLSIILGLLVSITKSKKS